MKKVFLQNYIIRPRINSYAAICNPLIKNYNFIDITNGNSSKGIKNKKEVIFSVLEDFVFVFRNYTKLKNANLILSTGYTALPVKLFIKLKLIKCNNFLWLGFFIHSPKMYSAFRRLLKLLSIQHEKLILFSKYEIKLYQEKLNLPSYKLIYLPYGDWWDEDSREVKLLSRQKYYFAGGYSNRDYKSIVEVFQKLPQTLVIVCSNLNSDFNEDDLSENIIVKKNISSIEFENLIMRSKACILPLKYNSGSAGQMVLLAYMRNKKTIVASNTDVVKEYIKDGSSGILYDKTKVELPMIIEMLENNPEKITEFGEKAYKKFKNEFSYEIITKQLTNLIERELQNDNSFIYHSIQTN